MDLQGSLWTGPDDLGRVGDRDRLPSSRRISSQIGEMPLDDSLAAVAWMQRALAVVAVNQLEWGLSDKDKRGEL